LQPTVFIPDVSYVRCQKLSRVQELAVGGELSTILLYYNTTQYNSVVLHLFIVFFRFICLVLTACFFVEHVSEHPVYLIQEFSHA